MLTLQQQRGSGQLLQPQNQIPDANKLADMAGVDTQVASLSWVHYGCMETFPMSHCAQCSGLRLSASLQCLLPNMVGYES